MVEKPKIDWKDDSFIERLSPNPVKTARFLWHIYEKDRAKDLSIAVYGLICPPNYAVFAHNHCCSLFDTYPFMMDALMECLMGGELPKFSQYTFWRIDTQKLNFDWYFDPNLYPSQPRDPHKIDYVCTPNHIPNSALKLFKFNEKRFQETGFIREVNDVFSYTPYHSDFDVLIPDHKMNSFIEWRNANPKKSTSI
jgi:hypothetical protein